MYVRLQALRAKVRGFHAAGVSISHRIRKASGPRRNRLWLEKRALGIHAREHLIAYCLLKGIQYEKIEGRCAKTNQPDLGRVFEIIRAHVTDRELASWTPQRLTELLAAPETSQEKRPSP